jgi:hypothetical protein
MVGTCGDLPAGHCLLNRRYRLPRASRRATESELKHLLVKVRERQPSK